MTMTEVVRATKTEAVPKEAAKEGTWMMLYPLQVDSTATLERGRAIAAALCPAKPQYVELAGACASMGLQWIGEPVCIACIVPCRGARGLTQRHRNAATPRRTYRWGGCGCS